VRLPSFFAIHASTYPTAKVTTSNAISGACFAAVFATPVLINPKPTIGPIDVSGFKTADFQSFSIKTEA